MHSLSQDVRHSVRLLLKHRGFTLVAVVAIALGVGANTAVFSVVNAALLRALPYCDADRLVDLSQAKAGAQVELRDASYPDFIDWKRRDDVLADAAGYTGGRSVTIDAQGAPERAAEAAVTSSFFDVLGVEPELGRSLRTNDCVAGAERVVVLSHGLWRRSFGGDPGVVGRTVVLDGEPHLVVGVLPGSFRFARLGPVELWTALVPPPYADRRNRYWLSVVARLRDGVTLERAREAMHEEGRRIASAYPDSHAGVEVVLAPLRDRLVGDVKPVLLALCGAVAFVLLIACTNVANLLLARSASRQKEIALRLALGASRLRVARQFLTESAVLAVVGGAAGLLLGVWGTDVLVSAIPASLAGYMPYLEDARLDGATFAFAFAVSLLTGLLFGLAPALRATRADPQGALKDGGKTSAAPARSALRDALVVSEIALALVLLVGAGLMVRSFVGLLRVDPGFATDEVLSVEVPLAGPRYSESEAVLVFHERLRERVAALPGVRAVAAVDVLPVRGGGGNTGTFSVRGRPAASPSEEPEANVRTITPDYFGAMGIPLVEGRGFDDRDDAARPRVVVVNRTLASRVFPGQEPVGQVITFGFDAAHTPYEIVGVVGDEKVGRIDSSTTPVVYFPHAQDGSAGMTLVVRAAGNPADLVGPIRDEVRGLDPGVALGPAMTMDDVIASSPSAFLRRYPAYLASVLAAIAFVLALEGIYGVISFSVGQRTREIGVRVAVGASRNRIYRLILGHGVVLAVSGVGAGLIASFALTRFLSSLLFGVSPTDPATFGVVAAVLATVTALACYLPARKAASVDPVVALRSE